MKALITYFSPVWLWVLLWWLLFNGTLLAFFNGVMGGMLDSFMVQLWGEIDQIKEWLKWM